MTAIRTMVIQLYSIDITSFIRYFPYKYVEGIKKLKFSLQL